MPRDLPPTARRWRRFPPLGHIGKPEDIAPGVVFLASSDSAWITGEPLYMMGGLR